MTMTEVPRRTALRQRLKTAHAVELIECKIVGADDPAGKEGQLIVLPSSHRLVGKVARTKKAKRLSKRLKGIDLAFLKSTGQDPLVLMRLGTYLTLARGLTRQGE
jgi:hypothetical protein